MDATRQNMIPSTLGTAGMAVLGDITLSMVNSTLTQIYNAIQDLNQKFDSLTQRVRVLENRLDAMQDASKQSEVISMKALAAVSVVVKENNLLRQRLESPENLTRPKHVSIPEGNKGDSTSVGLPESFEDVAITFSTEEWGLLKEQEKKLYREVMEDNYETMVSVARPQDLVVVKTEMAEGFPINGVSTSETGQQAFPKEFLLDFSETAEYEKNLQAESDVSQRSHTADMQLKCNECGERLPFYTDGFNATDALLLCPHCGGFTGLSHREPEKQNCITKQELKCSACGTGLTELPPLSEFQWGDTGEIHCLCVDCGTTDSWQASVQPPQQPTPPVQSESSAEEKPFKCTDCGKSFILRSNLSVHQLIHARQKLFTSTEAGDSKTDNPTVTEPLMIFNSEKDLDDSKTNRNFVMPELSTRQWIRTEDKRYQCLECGKRFPYKTVLVRHLCHHKVQKTFECTDCGKVFTRRQAFLTHQKSHKGEAVDKYRCSECDTSFVLKSDLCKHLRTHTEERLFKCSECGETFVDSTALLQHQQSHTGEAQFVHRESGSNFDPTGSLCPQLQQQPTENTFMCTECGKSFFNKAAFALHQQAHFRERPFICMECDKTFVTKEDLCEHVQAHRAEKKPYKCSFCGKSFLWLYGLQAHQRTHVQEKAF